MSIPIFISFVNRHLITDVIMILFCTMRMGIYSFLSEGKQFFQTHQKSLFLFFGLLLVAGTAFESGALWEKMHSSSPIIISLPEYTDNERVSVKENAQTKEDNTTKAVPETKKCVFIGSRYSNKYHLTTCSTAKRIKEENKVCFSSKEDAEKKGYIPGCIK